MASSPAFGQHPFTLSFTDPNLERDFWHQLYQERGHVTQGAIALLVVTMACLAPVDALFFPEMAAALLPWRALAVMLLLPPLPWVFGRNGRQFLARHGQKLLVYLAVMACGPLLPMEAVLVVGAGEEVLFLTVLTVLFAMAATYQVSGIRFYYAFLLGVVFTAAYTGILVSLGQPSPQFAAVVATFLLGGSVMGLAVSYALERYARRDFLQRRELERETERSSKLLLNVMPSVFADRLRGGSGAVVDRVSSASVLFVTFTGFDRATAAMEPLQVVSLLDQLVERFDARCAALGVERIKTIGAACMAAAGIPTQQSDHAERAAALALAVREDVRAFAAQTGLAVTARIGVATGPVVAGVIGRTRYAFDCWGDTTNTAARLDTHGEADQIHLCARTAVALPDALKVTPRGRITLKGKGEVSTFWLNGPAT